MEEQLKEALRACLEVINDEQHQRRNSAISKAEAALAAAEGRT